MLTKKTVPIIIEVLATLNGTAKNILGKLYS
jgi:hypothetical protein